MRIPLIAKACGLDVHTTARILHSDKTIFFREGKKRYFAMPPSAMPKPVPAPVPPPIVQPPPAVVPPKPAPIPSLIAPPAPTVPATPPESAPAPEQRYKAAPRGLSVSPLVREEKFKMAVFMDGKAPMGGKEIAAGLGMETKRCTSHLNNDRAAGGIYFRFISEGQWIKNPNLKLSHEHHPPMVKQGDKVVLLESKPKPPAAQFPLLPELQPVTKRLLPVVASVESAAKQTIYTATLAFMRREPDRAVTPNEIAEHIGARTNAVRNMLWVDKGKTFEQVDARQGTIPATWRLRS